MQEKYQIINRIINNIKKLLFFSFLCIYKIYLISVGGYKNAGVHCLRIKETDEIWVNMKHVGNGLNVKNMSDLVLKEVHGVCGNKQLIKEEIKNYKVTEREIYEN